MNKTTILIFGILTFSLNVTAQFSSDHLVEIDSLFHQWDSENSPGVAIGVVQNGRLIFTKGYGMADLEHDIPITSS